MQKSKGVRMSKKSREERKAAHRNFEQRLAARRAGSAENNDLSPTRVKAAIAFGQASDADRFADVAMMPSGVLAKIANGNFTASHNQARLIISAATSLGWTP
jgi:hypothetical protein